MPIFHFYQQAGSKSPASLFSDRPCFGFVVFVMLGLLQCIPPAFAQNFVTVGNPNATQANQRIPIHGLSYNNYSRFGWSNILLVDSLLASVNLPSGVLIDSVVFFKTSAHATIHPFDLRMFMGPANQAQPPLLQQNWLSVLQGKKEVLHDSAFDLGTAHTPVVMKFYRAYPYWSGGLQLAIMTDYGPFPGFIHPYSGPGWVADQNFRNNSIQYIGNTAVFDSTAQGINFSTHNRMPVMRIYFRHRQQKDLGVRVISLTSHFIQPYTPFNLQVEVTNEGTDTLQSANLSFQVDQSTPISQNFSFQLPPDSSIMLSFTIPIQLPVGYENNLRVWLNHVDGGQLDQVPSNDSLRTWLYPLISGDTIHVGQQLTFPHLQAVFDRLMVGNNPDARTILLHENQIGNFSLSDYQLPDTQTLVLRGIHDSIRIEAAQHGRLLLLNRVRGIRVEGLHFEHLPTANTNTNDILLQIKESGRISIHNNRFWGATGSNRNDLVWVDNSRKIVVQDNFFSAGYQAFHAGATQIPAANGDFIIRKNRFENQYSHGIRFSGNQLSDSLWIEDNVIHNSLVPMNTASGFELAYVSRLHLTRNKITGELGRHGIRVHNVVGDSTQPNRIYNNVISGTFSHGVSSALRIEGLNQANDSMRNYLEIYFNSFQMRRLSSPGYGSGVVDFTPTYTTNTVWNRFIFQNNLLILDAPANAYNAGAMINQDVFGLYHPNITLSHNHFHVPGQSIYWFHIGTQYSTLPAFRFYHPNIDTASTVGDPLLFNALVNDLLFFNNSPLHGTGLPISTVNTDILGLPRNNPPDRGAYSYQAAVNRTQLTRLLSPEPNSILLHDSNYALTVQIQNTGGSTINHIDFAYVFGQGDTLQGSWTGQLAAGDSLQYSFPQPLRIASDSVFIPTLKVWNKQLIGNFIPTPQLDTLSNVYCTPVCAGTYIVNDLDGGPQSIKSWVNLLNCGGVTGPVTFKTDFQNNLLLDEPLNFVNIAGLSNSNQLILDGDGDTLRSSIFSNQPFIHLNKANHIRIQGFVFDYRLISNSNALILAQKSNHITIINNRFFSNNTSINLTAVRSTAFDGVPVNHGHSHYLRVDSNIFEGSISRAVEVLGTNSSLHRHLQIHHNQILTSPSAAGIIVQFVDSGEIAYNYITQLNSNIISNFGIGMYDQNSELRIHNNKIYGFTSQSAANFQVGIYVRSKSLLSGGRNYIYNNLIFGFHGKWSQAGIYTSRTDSLDIANNTICIQDTFNVRQMYGIWLDSSSVAKVWNNNISLSPKPISSAVAMRYGQPANLGIDHNNYHVEISNPNTQYVIQNSSGSFASLGAHRIAQPQFDAMSHSNSPLFKDVLAQDFVPLSPLLYQSGRVIPYVFTDFRGGVRPAVPSIGAFEDSAVSLQGLVLIAFSDFRSENGGTQPHRQAPIELALTGSLSVDSLVLSYRKNQDNWQTDSMLYNLAGRQIIQRSFGSGITLSNGTDTLQAIATAYYDGQPIADTVIRIVQNQFLTAVGVPYSQDFDSLQSNPAYHLLESEYSLAEIMGPPDFNQVIQGQSSLVMRAKPGSFVLPAGTNAFNAFQNALGHISEARILVNPGRTGKLRVSFRLRMMGAITNTNYFRFRVNDSTITAQPGPGTYPAVFVHTSNNVFTLNFVLDYLNTGAPMLLSLQSVVAPYYLAGGAFACNIIDSLRIYFEPDVDFSSLSLFNDTLCTPMARNISVTAVPFMSNIDSINLYYSTNPGNWSSLPMNANGQANGYSVVLPPQTASRAVKYTVTARVSNGIWWPSDTLEFENVPYRVDLGADQSIIIGQSASLQVSLVDKGIKALRITEFQYFRSGQGYHPNYPPGINSTHDDMIEIANYGNEVVSLDNAELHFVGQSVNSSLIYHFPVGIQLQPFERALVVLGAGTDDPVSKLFFSSHPNSLIINYSSSLKGYVVLRDRRSTRFIDGLCINDSIFPTSMQVPAQLWSGLLNGASKSGIQRIDLNAVTAQAWLINSTTQLHTIGSIDSSLNFGPSPQDIKWFDVHGQLLGTGYNLVVTPSSSSQYVATVEWFGCIQTDTLLVVVSANNQPDLSISNILAPEAADTVVLNSPLVPRVRVKNLNTGISNSFDLSFWADSALVGSVNVTQGLAGYDSLDVVLPAWTPDPRNYNLCFELTTANDYDSTNNRLCVNDIHFVITISVREMAAKDLLVYPNPVRELLYLRAPEGRWLQGDWMAVDATGRRIGLSDVVEIAPGLLQFSVSQLAAGIYYLQFNGTGGRELQQVKFVVIR